MNDLEIYIKRHFSITSDHLKLIADLFVPELLKKNDYFSVSGSPCSKMGFVKSGFLRFYASHKEREVTQWIASGGSFVGDIASLTIGGPSKWNIQALSDVQLFVISKQRYDTIDKLIPEWPYIEKNFIVKCFVMMEDRIFGFLSISAEERYAAFWHHNKGLFNQVPLHYIASMLGMTPETFSRIRKNIR